MQNINYDLIKLLHAKLDTIWRLEQFYIKDAQEAKCHSVKALQTILEEEKRHAQMILDEINMRMQANVCN